MTSGPPEPRPLSLTWIGHSTVLLELDGVRFLTDPLLRSRVAHLRRVHALDSTALGHIDAVLISHAHYDHLDVPSLRRLDVTIPVVAPLGSGSVLRRAGRERIRELEVGEEIAFGGVTVRATQAEHAGGRAFHRSESIGFAIEGSASAYFAGDTDLFAGMADLGPFDLVLVPVWGWGSSLGEGHLDPHRAATAVSLLRARVAVPIHWGTYYPLHQRRGPFLSEPPLEFRRAAAEVAPETRVEVLALGESLEVTPEPEAAPRAAREQGRQA
jgi:L-ascorbate metabolism protein UlaG (beta-lactamase superfamily)